MKKTAASMVKARFKSKAAASAGGPMVVVAEQEPLQQQQDPPPSLYSATTTTTSKSTTTAGCDYYKYKEYHSSVSPSTLHPPESSPSDTASLPISPVVNITSPENQHQPQQQQQPPTTDDPGYVAMMEEGGNHPAATPTNCETNNVGWAPTANSNHPQTSTTNQSTTRAPRQQQPQWFNIASLEPTPEDRLSLHIIREEIKEVFWELFHFIKHRHWKKKLLTVVVVVASCLVFVDLFFLGNIRRWIDHFLIWMTAHPALAELAFILFYIAATLFFIPPTVLLLGAGWAFANAFGMFQGFVLAVLSCFVASVIGALLSFVRARYMMRDLIHLFAKRYPIVKAADRALKRDGFRIMLLLRLCPLVPFHSLNYLGGISGLAWETFVYSLIGILPYQILVIFMGASAGTLHSLDNANDSNIITTDTTTNDDDLATDGVTHGSNWMSHITPEQQQECMVFLTSVGVATFVIAMVLAFRFTMKELRKELQMGEGEMESYLVSVRRMSIIDLYSDELEANVDESVEVTCTTSSASDGGYTTTLVPSDSNTNNTNNNHNTEQAGITRHDFSSGFSSSVAYNAMGEAT